MSKESISETIDYAGLDPGFKKEIADIVGENVMSCYQCGECTAGCPVAFAMDLAPNQVMRMAQLGMRDKVLDSSAIWLCAGCETCATRCPRGIAYSRVVDACRQIAAREGRKSKQPGITAFHDEFLRSVKTFGRTHELSMMGFYKLRTRDFFSDIFQGIQMFLKGKFGLIPGLVKGRKEVQGLFKK